MANPVIHFEFMSRDPEQIGAFYKKVFDWTITPQPEFSYNIVEPGVQGDMKGISGGIFKPPQPEPWPAQTTMYILVDDLAAYRKRITDAGGKILIEEMKVGEMGSLTLFTDPEGRMMGLWRAAQAG